VAVILAAKSKLVASGNVQLVINDQTPIAVPAGGERLGALAENQIFVGSACGGGGVATRTFSMMIPVSPG
jgi:Na+-transporting NADH:ubiquinone oxidoreductase subunit F